MKKLITTLMTISSLFAFGQVPQGFSYQAVAFNSAGSPVVSSAVSVRISILDNSASGTTLYTETHSKTTNASGLYSLTIGQGTPTLGTFTSINWSVNSKFVKVELDPTGGTTYTTVGTSQFLSVPFALIADSVIKYPTEEFNIFSPYLLQKNVDTIAKIDTASSGIISTLMENADIKFVITSGKPEDIYVKLVSKNFSDFQLFYGNVLDISTIPVGTIFDTLLYSTFSKKGGDGLTFRHSLINLGPPYYNQFTRTFTIELRTKTKLLATITRRFYIKYI